MFLDRSAGVFLFQKERKRTSVCNEMDLGYKMLNIIGNGYERHWLMY